MWTYNRSGITVLMGRLFMTRFVQVGCGELEELDLWPKQVLLAMNSIPSLRAAGISNFNVLPDTTRPLKSRASEAVYHTAHRSQPHDDSPETSSASYTTLRLLGLV